MATARPLAIIDALLSTIDYLRISVGDGDDRWLSCATLVGDPTALGATIASTKADQGTDRDVVATSLFVQGYAFRLATVAVGSWMLGGAVLDVSPTNTTIAIDRGRPNAVNLAIPRARSAAAVSDVHAVLIDGHLASLVATARRTCRIGSALLWGNVAASCAASFGAFAGELPARRSELGDRTEEFFATARPEIRDAGRLVLVGERFAWERRSCCLWYRTASAWLCEDCPLRPGAPRRARTMEDPDART